MPIDTTVALLGIAGRLPDSIGSIRGSPDDLIYALPVVLAWLVWSLARLEDVREFRRTLTQRRFRKAMEQTYEAPDLDGMPGGQTTAISPGWFPDPYFRHELRYWSGTFWTEHVSNDRVVSVDPPPRR